MRFHICTALLSALLCSGGAHGQASSHVPSPQDNEAIEVPEHFWVKPTWGPSWDGPRFPMIRGRTNLPNGVTIVVMIKKAYLPNAAERIAKGMPPCAANCDPALAGDAMAPRVVVQDGAFSVGPFSLNGAAFLPGHYHLEIYVPAGRSRSIGKVNDREWVDRLMESFRTPVYQGNIDMP